MKASYKLLFVFSLLISSAAMAQQKDTGFAFLGNQFDEAWETNQVKVWGELNAGSNTLNTGMFSDYLFRTAFSPENKSGFVSTDKERTNLMYAINAGAEIKLSCIWGVYGKNSQASFFTMGNDLSKLLLFGNAMYAGMEVRSLKNHILQYNATSFGVTHNTLRNNKWQIKTGFGLTYLSQYNRYQADNITLYTAEDGGYIDATIKNGKWTSSDISQPGMGIDLNVDVSYAITKQSKIDLSIHDVNVLFVPKGKEYRIDTNFRFEGMDYVLTPGNSEFLVSGDSVFSSFTNRESFTKQVVLLPSTVTVNYTKELNTAHHVGVTFQTRSFAQLGSNVSLHHFYTSSKNVRLRSSLAYGDFIGLSWNEALEVRMNKTSLFLSAVGLNALVLPRSSHSYGLALGVSRFF